METVSLPLVSRFMLDMSRRSGIRSELRVRVGDSSSHLLEIVPVFSGKTLSVGENAVVTFFAERPDGTVIYADCDVTEDCALITHTLSSSELASAGRLSCEIRIVSGDSSLTSPRFYITVEDTVMDPAAIEASDEFSALDSALLRINSAIDGLSAKADKVSGDVEGTLAVLDENGNLSSSGTSVDSLMPKINDESAGGNIPVISDDGGISDSGVPISEVAKNQVIYANITSMTKRVVYATSNTDSIEDGQELLLFYDGDEDYVFVSGLQFELTGKSGVTFPRTLIHSVSDSTIIYKGGFTELLFKDGHWYSKSDVYADNVYYGNEDTFLTASNVQDALTELSTRVVIKSKAAKFGSTVPTQYTVADYEGQFYTNTATGKLYQCVDIIGASSSATYSWIAIN